MKNTEILAIINLYTRVMYTIYSYLYGGPGHSILYYYTGPLLVDPGPKVAYSRYSGFCGLKWRIADKVDPEA